MLSSAAIFLLASCAHAPPTSRLIGAWTATSQNAAGSSFLFRPDGSATWNLGRPFEIRYRIDDRAAPARLDLSGFETGPLKGRTLHCLVELANDMLRLDCDPTTYPASFDPEQTQVFARQAGGA